MTLIPPEEISKLRAAFRMPSFQTMVSRKSSITNAFVNSLIPVIEPKIEDIIEALRILGMSPSDVRCAYCGDKSTEWDHLRPLVVNRRPTGYISEIANLVPACGKCNQSKGNKNWLKWMMSGAPHAPAKRGIADLPRRIERLHAYEAWRPIVPVPFEQIVGVEAYADYWKKLDAVVKLLSEYQTVANQLRQQIALAHGASLSAGDVAPVKEA
jgi:HNH endonuclease